MPPGVGTWREYLRAAVEVERLALVDIPGIVPGDNRHFSTKALLVPYHHSNPHFQVVPRFLHCDVEP